MIKPMLCQLKVKPFNHPDWIWERKYDGIRIVAHIQGDRVTLTSRSGKDKTAQFPELQALQVIGDDIVLDGEVVAANGESFQEFTQRRANRTEDIDKLACELPAKYMVFDILRHNGIPFDDMCYVFRRSKLSSILIPSQVAEGVEQYADGEALYHLAIEKNWEGIVGKNRLGYYHQGKREWIKVKLWHRGVFEVYGYTPGLGRRDGFFGALCIREVSGEPVGEVGTGFTDVCLRTLYDYLWGRAIPQAGVPMKWQAVEPFRVRIKFMERTNDGKLRFPVYQGMED